jgi:hypothetical protein
MQGPPAHLAALRADRASGVALAACRGACAARRRTGRRRTSAPSTPRGARTNLDFSSEATLEGTDAVTRRASWKKRLEWDLAQT